MINHEIINTRFPLPKLLVREEPWRDEEACKQLELLDEQDRSREPIDIEVDAKGRPLTATTKEYFLLLEIQQYALQGHDARRTSRPRSQKHFSHRK